MQHKADGNNIYTNNATQSYTFKLRHLNTDILYVYIVIV